MNDTPKPEFDRQLTALLTQAVADVQLSPAARTRMAARLRDASPARSWLSWFVPAAAVVAVVVAAVTVPVLWQRAQRTEASHAPSWIVCQATTYSTTEPDQWVRRSLIVHRRNGTESFIAVAAVRSLPTPTP